MIKIQNHTFGANLHHKSASKQNSQSAYFKQITSQKTFQPKAQSNNYGLRSNNGIIRSHVAQCQCNTSLGSTQQQAILKLVSNLLELLVQYLGSGNSGQVGHCGGSGGNLGNFGFNPGFGNGSQGGSHGGSGNGNGSGVSVGGSAGQGNHGAVLGVGNHDCGQGGNGGSGHIHGEPPKAGEYLKRLVKPGHEAKTGELSGQDRPNPRAISNAVADQGGAETSNKNGASDLLWSWGQFIDHDITLTREGEEKANISVPKGDPKMDPMGTGRAIIPFTRSASEVDGNGNHQQINDQTPLIDGSMVYGTSDEQTTSLRTLEGGKMKLVDGHLPPDAEHKVLAGDPRAAEQPGLLSLHTLFVREHNRLADVIAERNPGMSDDAIFSEAKRLVTAEIQAITYNEFLSTLLGDRKANPDNYHYGAGPVDGRISNEFASAAYRLGHTMVSDGVAVKNADGSIEKAKLSDVFFNPEFTTSKGIGAILSGQSENTAEKVDPMIVDSLRNQLFGPPGTMGLDLASLNIQRGRDHNLPTYNEMRLAMGLPPVTSFNDPIFQNGVGEKLASVYDSPDDIDLWVGGLAEKPVGSSMLGATFTGIVGDQFARLAQADPNFYTHTASHAEQRWLNNLTLSDIIRANSDTPVLMDDTAFIATDNTYYGW